MANITVYVLRDVVTQTIYSVGIKPFTPATGQEQVTETIDSADLYRFTTKYKYDGVGNLIINGKTFYRLEITNDEADHDPVDSDIPKLDLGGTDFMTVTISKMDLDGNYLTRAGDNDTVYIKGTGKNCVAADPVIGVSRGFVINDLTSQVINLASTLSNVTGVTITAVSDDTPGGIGTLTYNKTIYPTNQPINVTGVTIDSYSDDTNVGNDGTLTYTAVGTSLTWQAPGDAGSGAGVNIGAGGNFSLASADGSTITITVNAGTLPGGDQVDNNITTELRHYLKWAAFGEAAGAEVDVTVGGVGFTLNSGTNGDLTVTVATESLPVSDTSDNVTISVQDEYITTKNVDPSAVAVIVSGVTLTDAEFSVAGNIITLVIPPDINDNVSALYQQAIEGEITSVSLTSGVSTFRVYAATERGYSTFRLTAEVIADSTFVVLTD